MNNSEHGGTVYTADLKSAGEIHAGSNPAVRTKICCVCNIEKSVNEFNFKTKKNNIYQSRCRSCQKIYHDNYYLGHKQSYAASKERGKLKGYNSDKQLTEYINAFKINGCVLCDEKFYGALDFHHIDPKQKDKSVAKMTSRKAVKKEIEKCVVLCSNCHRKFHGKHEVTTIALNKFLVSVRV